MARAALVSVLLGSLLQVTAYCTLADSTIYRCEVDGVLTFSDRPCGVDSTTYQPDAARVSTYKAPSSPQVSRASRAPAPRRKAARSPVADGHAKRAKDCERIRTSVRDVRSKMRAGYNVKEGERLKERLAKLNDRRRVQRCP